jgi:hypothetical protein
MRSGGLGPGKGWALLVLGFEGWAQCRLATDPDPSDEPRGVSGWTYAVAGEPDLDRILRFQPEEATPRTPGPRIGVAINRHAVHGRPVDPSPLRGVPVTLLDAPVFDGRNGLSHEDQKEPIVPFHLRIEGTGVVVDRRHVDALGRPISTIPRPAAPPAGPISPGVPKKDDWVRFRTERLRDLKEALARASTPVEKVALERRRRACVPDENAIATKSLGFALRYEIPLAGPDPIVEDPGGILGRVQAGAAWVVRFVVGIWDADALSAYVRGELEVPLHDGP